MVRLRAARAGDHDEGAGRARGGGAVHHHGAAGAGRYARADEVASLEDRVAGRRDGGVAVVSLDVLAFRPGVRSRLPARRQSLVLHPARAVLGSRDRSHVLCPHVRRRVLSVEPHRRRPRDRCRPGLCGSAAPTNSGETLLWIWVLVVIGFFSLARFKLDHYIFPAAPACCLLAAHAWRLAADDADGWLRGTRLSVLAVAALLILAGSAGSIILFELDLELPPDRDRAAADARRRRDRDDAAGRATAMGRAGNRRGRRCDAAHRVRHRSWPRWVFPAFELTRPDRASREQAPATHWSDRRRWACTARNDGAQACGTTSDGRSIDLKILKRFERFSRRAEPAYVVMLRREYARSSEAWRAHPSLGATPDCDRQQRPRDQAAGVGLRWWSQPMSRWNTRPLESLSAAGLADSQVSRRRISGSRSSVSRDSEAIIRPPRTISADTKWNTSKQVLAYQCRCSSQTAEIACGRVP